MAEINYGVVQQDGGWTIIRNNLRFGRYAQGSRCARRAGWRRPLAAYRRSSTSRPRLASCRRPRGSAPTTDRA
ncbi:MAG: hypothetical protein ABI655_05445 [Phenylobacterium sp.]